MTGEVRCVPAVVAGLVAAFVGSGIALGAVAVPTAKQLFGHVATPTAGHHAQHRLLRQGMPRRRRSAAPRRPALAGHAPVAQSPLGQPRAHIVPGEILRRRRQGRLAGPAHRRHVAAARRPHADRPRQPPDRARRRHLVHADARSHTDADERETLSATSLLIKGKLAVDPKKWSDVYARLLKQAVSYPEVERIS